MVVPLRSNHSRKALYQLFSPLVADIDAKGWETAFVLQTCKSDEGKQSPPMTHGLSVKTNLHTSVLKLVFNRKAVDLIYWPSVLRP